MELTLEQRLYRMEILSGIEAFPKEWIPVLIRVREASGLGAESARRLVVMCFGDFEESMKRCC